MSITKKNRIRGSGSITQKNNRLQKTWQELESRNITFADELDFDIRDLDSIYDDIGGHLNNPR